MFIPLFRNPSAAPQGAKNICKDPSQKIRSLNFLVQQIKTYYLVSASMFFNVPFLVSHLCFKPYNLSLNQI